MKTVVVNKEELLKKIKSNLALHLKNYKEAVAGYRSTALEYLDKHYKKAVEGINKEKPEAAHFSSLPPPVSYETDYNTAIQMLEFSVDSDIELTLAEFKSYVQDEWTWKGIFEATNSHYTNK